MHTRSLTALALFAAATVLGGCVREVDDTRADTATSATGTQGGDVAVPVQPPPDPPMRIEVDLAARKLYVHRDGAPTDTHAVAVGSQEWPTQTGSWRISQVIFNPEWVPPDEEWAKDEKRKAPGASDNPLGQAQLIYDPPRTIHGTNEPSSIGKAVSHGSIRMRNAEIVALAKLVMEAGGASKDSSFFAQARRNRTEKQVVDLPNPVPITVR
jgi:lipoprotein-anchoring transpeptidase ErfK/SrfK